MTARGCQRSVEQSIATLGGMDILVNSAGVGTNATVEETTEDIWDATLDINLKWLFFCCQAAMPALKKSKGSIVNIASDSGVRGDVYLAAYRASKAAVMNMSRSMALAPDVRINAVCPGYVNIGTMRRDYIEKVGNPAEAAIKNFAPL